MLEIIVLAWDMHNHVAVLNRLMGPPPPPRGPVVGLNRLMVSTPLDYMCLTCNSALYVSFWLTKYGRYRLSLRGVLFQCFHGGYTIKLNQRLQ